MVGGVECGVYHGLQAWAGEEDLYLILLQSVGEDCLHQWQQHCLVHPAYKGEGEGLM